MNVQPKYIRKTEGSFSVPSCLSATAHPALCKDIFGELWHNFTLSTSTLLVTECAEHLFSVGGTEPLPLDGAEYSIRITPDGLCVYAENQKDLIRGFFGDYALTAEVGGRSVTATAALSSGGSGEITLTADLPTK